jgi:hypothetical protein
MLFSGAWGKRINEKNLKQKSRGTVTLKIALILPTIYSVYYREFGLFRLNRLRKMGNYLKEKTQQKNEFTSLKKLGRKLARAIDLKIALLSLTIYSLCFQEFRLFWMKRL